MNDSSKKVSRFPTVAIFFVLWFIARGIFMPLYQVFSGAIFGIVESPDFSMFLPSFEGFVYITVVSIAFITIAVMQMLRKCNFLVTIAAILLISFEFYWYMESVYYFITDFFRDFNVEYMISSLVDGTTYLTTIISLIFLVITSLYGMGKIKRLGKFKLLIYMPIVFSILSFVSQVLYFAIQTMQFGLDYFIEQPVNQVTVLYWGILLPVYFWYTLAIISTSLWVGKCGKVREAELVAATEYTNTPLWNN